MIILYHYHYLKFLNNNFTSKSSSFNAMVVSCCVGECTKKSGDTSNVPLRGFIRWYKFPDDQKLCKQWILRINRKLPHVKDKTPTLRVCSDHFCTEDFVPGDLTRFSLQPTKSQKIRHKADAVPNTCRASGKYVKRPSNVDQPAGSNQRGRRDFSAAHIEKLVSQNEIVLDNLPSLPGTALVPEPVTTSSDEPSLESDDAHVDAVGDEVELPQSKFRTTGRS